MAAAQVATIVISWDLWQARVEPPNIGFVSVLEPIPMGVAIVASAVAAVVWPRRGATAHVAVVGLALLGDHFRALPEVVSLAVLLGAFGWLVPDRGDRRREGSDGWRRDRGARLAAAVGLAHVASLWLWAGLHKALSIGWGRGGAVFIAHTLHIDGAVGVVAWGLPIVEIALGVLVIVLPARRRRWLAVPAVLLHLGILATLVLDWYNEVVWPWNVALAVAAPALLIGASRRSSRSEREPDVDLEPARPVADEVGDAAGRGAVRERVAAGVAVAAWVALVVLPAGFYVGAVDTYLSHNLYSGNGASFRWCDTAGRCDDARVDAATRRFHSPLPPEPALFVAWFQRVCRPGETLRVTVPTTRIGRAGAGATTVTCPAPS